MSLDLTKITPATKPTAKPRRSLAFRLAVACAAGMTTLALAGAWRVGYRPSNLWEKPPERLALLDVAEGDLAVFVVETGSIESASNTTVKCQVEALIGMVGGTTTGSGRSGAGGAASKGAAGGSSSAQGAQAPGVSTTPSASKGSSKSKGSGSSKSGGGGSSGGSSKSKKKSSGGGGGWR